MEVSKSGILDFIQKSPQLVVPIYQRTYSWSRSECEQLWKDIVRTGKDDQLTGHFLGSIVYIEDAVGTVSKKSPLMVIDGQQRLTSVTLLLAALRDALRPDEEVSEVSAPMILDFYLTLQYKSGQDRYKLLLTETDRDSLIALVNRAQQPQKGSQRIAENYKFFQDKIASLAGNYNWLVQGLQKLTVVEIALDRQYDNPQLIFESMNSTGRELTQADLIRNFVLMGLEPELQSKIYTSWWRPMERQFGQQAYSSYFDDFVRHYLTVRTGSIPRLADVYDAFKQYASTKLESGLETDQDTALEDLIADLRRLADFYCRIVLNQESSRRLARAFRDLRELKVDVAYPLLIEMYVDYSDDKLSEEEFEAALRTVESYVFRRVICQIPTNSLNKTFSTILRFVDRSNYVQSLQAEFRKLPSYRRLPDDSEFTAKLLERDLYNFQRRTYWFRRMENYNRKELVPVDEYTIEHIMPQNHKLSAEWKESLGQDWQRIHEQYLHTVGNLTLTGYNSEYSDRPFRDKRDMQGGFRESPIRMNSALATLEDWNESEILSRAQLLAEKAVGIWEYPKVPLELLKSPETSSEDDGGSIAQFPYLAPHHRMREVFDLLNHEILALDPTISRVVQARWVSYQVEDDFVSIQPMATRLRLVFNITYPELFDPKDLVLDTTGQNRWGVGDAEFDLRSIEDVPYALGLVRQCLELQLGNDEAFA